MGRLILVPQYPTPLRYQEWWWKVFPKELAKYFDEVIVLGNKDVNIVVPFLGEFAPMQIATSFEARQIEEYLFLDLKNDDTLLLCDLSFPGLFAQALYHKRPKKCFAICHATSLNRFDYYAKDRQSKYPVEKAVAKVFDRIFVGSLYHKHKLRGWKNITVTGMPFAPFTGEQNIKEYNIVSVARRGKQKRNARLENLISKALGCEIITPRCRSWVEYYDFLSKSKVMLITSNEETFGYQVLDAITNGCIPIAPNRYSYPELVSKNYLYNNYIEAIELVDDALAGKLSVPRLLIQDNFFGKVSYIMQNT
jgi:hypothetical protein